MNKKATTAIILTLVVGISIAYTTGYLPVTANNQTPPSSYETTDRYTPIIEDITQTLNISSIKYTTHFSPLNESTIISTYQENLTSDGFEIKECLKSSFYTLHSHLFVYTKGFTSIILITLETNDGTHIYHATCPTLELAKFI